MKPFARYARLDHEVTYSVGPDATIVAEEDGFFTLYEVAVTDSDGAAFRHLLLVPYTISAASFDIGLALLERDSAEVDAGNARLVGRLASAVKRDYRRLRTFPPPPRLNRFCL